MSIWEHEKSLKMKSVQKLEVNSFYYCKRKKTLYCNIRYNYNAKKWTGKKNFNPFHLINDSCSRACLWLGNFLVHALRVLMSNLPIIKVLMYKRYLILSTGTQAHKKSRKLARRQRTSRRRLENKLVLKIKL